MLLYRNDSKKKFSLELGPIYIHLFPWRLYKIVISKYIVYVHKFKIRLQNYLQASLDAFGLYSGFFFKFIYYLTKFYVYKNFFYWIGIKWAYLPDIYVVIMSNNISYFRLIFCPIRFKKYHWLKEKSIKKIWTKCALWI